MLGVGTEPSVVFRGNGWKLFSRIKYAEYYSFRFMEKVYELLYLHVSLTSYIHNLYSIYICISSFLVLLQFWNFFFVLFILIKLLIKYK